MRALALCGLLAASSAVPIYNLTDGAQGPYGARPTPVPTLILWRAPQPLLDYCVGSSRALSVAPPQARHRSLALRSRRLFYTVIIMVLTVFTNHLQRRPVVVLRANHRAGNPYGTGGCPAGETGGKVTVGGGLCICLPKCTGTTCPGATAPLVVAMALSRPRVRSQHGQRKLTPRPPRARAPQHPPTARGSPHATSPRPASRRQLSARSAAAASATARCAPILRLARRCVPLHAAPTASSL